MEQNKIYSEEDIDYLREIMNIGSGNAATALSQFFNCEVEVNIPKITVVPFTKVNTLIKEPGEPVICVKMELIGDVKGVIFFIVPNEQKKNLLSMVKRIVPISMRRTILVNITVFEEIANITTGVFLSSIHDFTKLNIYHTLPNMVIDMVQSLLDDSIISLSSEGNEVIIIENEFSIKEGNINTLLIVLPILSTLEIFFKSITAARKGMGVE